MASQASQAAHPGNNEKWWTPIKLILDPLLKETHDSDALLPAALADLSPGMRLTPWANYDDKATWWTSIRLVLEPMFTFSNETLHADLPYPVTPAAYSATHAAAFNWVRHKSDILSLSRDIEEGYELYPLLECLLEDRCRILHKQLILLMGKELLMTYNQLYHSFLRRAATAARVLSSLDRDLWVKHKLPDHSWLLVPHPKASEIEEEEHPPEEWIREMDERKHEALVSTWEMPQGSLVNSKEWAQAVQRSEAAEDPTQAAYVGVYALVLRRWRINVLEPLLAGPVSTEQLSAFGSDAGMNVDTISLLQSMKDVGLKRDNFNRMQLQEMYIRASQGLGST
jgi:hypothetical protein